MTLFVTAAMKNMKLHCMFSGYARRSTWSRPIPSYGLVEGMFISLTSKIYYLG